MHPIYVLFFLQYVERILNYRIELKMQNKVSLLIFMEHF